VVGEQSQSVCTIIHKKKLSCGGEPVARRAQAENLTKCRRKCSEEQRKSRKDKLRRESGEKYSKGRIL
jgi:hypothetical protein